MVTQQVLEYIKQQLSLGVGKENIVASLRTSGWSETDINQAINSVSPIQLSDSTIRLSSQPQFVPNNVNTSVKQESTSSVSARTIKFIITLFIVILLGLGVFFVINNNGISSMIVDRKNGFQFSNIQGWEKIPPRGNDSLSLATIKNGDYVLSYAGVIVTPNDMPDKFISRMLSEDYTAKITESCKNIASDKKIIFLSISKVIIPNTNSYLCKFEGIGENTNGNIVSMEALTIIKSKKNLTVTTSYQKNLPEERANVDRLMSGFQVIN